jgi:predicted HicB family RNase H-like nuclease
MSMSKIERRLQNAKVKSPLVEQLKARNKANLSSESSPAQKEISEEPKKYPKKKKTVMFQIDEQDLLALTELAKKQDRSISSFIRILIKSAIAINGQNRLD